MNTLRTFREGILNGLLIMQRPPTKYVANTPSGVGADSSCPYPDIIKYIYSFHHKRAFAPHFVGVFIFAGTINRSPTAACGLPLHCERIAKTLRTNCDNIADGLPKHCERITITIQTGWHNAADAYKKQKRHVAKNHVPPINLLTLKFLEITLQLLRSLLLKLRIVGIPNRLGYLRRLFLVLCHRLDRLLLGRKHTRRYRIHIFS